MAKGSVKFAEYAPAFCSGLFLFLSFPVFDYYFLAWIALVPFLLALWEKNPKEVFYSGFLFGLTYFFGTLYWIYYSIHHYGSFSFLSSLFLVLLLCCYLGLFPAVFSVIFIHLYRNTKFPALLLAPAVWVSFEFLRSYLFTGFPWSSIGYSQYKFIRFIQIADVTGIYGITFLVVSFNGAIVDLILLRKRLQAMPLYPAFYPLIGIFFLVIILVISLVYGTLRLNESRIGNQITVSIIQGNIDQGEKWEPLQHRRIMNTYFEMSRKASLESVDLIVWPETSIPFYFGSDKEQTEDLVGFQKKLNSYLLAGTITEKKLADKGRGFSNSAVLLNEEGQLVYQYDKIHMVPFGEYVPLRRLLFFIDKLVFGIGDYIPGNEYGVAKTDIGKFSTLICYEIIFPGLVRKFFRSGGDFIVTITNDAWFGNTSGPYQHFSMAVFRAIENRKPVVRAANSGISGFIDSNGVILTRSSLFERTSITNKIKKDQTITFYSKFGDLFSYICIIISIVLLLNSKLRRY